MGSDVQARSAGLESSGMLHAPLAEAGVVTQSRELPSRTWRMRVERSKGSTLDWRRPKSCVTVGTSLRLCLPWVPGTGQMELGRDPQHVLCTKPQPSSISSHTLNGPYAQVKYTFCSLEDCSLKLPHLCPCCSLCRECPPLLPAPCFLLPSIWSHSSSFKGSCPHHIHP